MCRLVCAQHRFFYLLCFVLLLFIACGRDPELKRLEIRSWSAVDHFATMQMGKFDIYYIMCAAYLEMPTSTWALLYRSEKQLTLQDAREMAKKFAHQFWKFVKEQPELNKWEHLAKYYQLKCAPGRDINSCSFRIRFFEKKYEWMRTPYICEIRVLGRNAKYYTIPNPETVHSTLVFEEEIELPDNQECYIL